MALSRRVPSPFAFPNTLQPVPCLKVAENLTIYLVKNAENLTIQAILPKISQFIWPKMPKISKCLTIF